MNDRDRLIEIIYCAGRDYDDYVDAQHEIGMSAYEDFDSWLADDLLANGVIVPPCKVGDVLYDIYDCETIREIKVTEINIRLDKRNKSWLIIGGYYYAFDDFGKTVFLTKEEAENALKERE